VIVLSEKNRSVDEVDIDFDRLARISQKVNAVLVKKTNSIPEAYAALRFMCVYYEQTLGITFMPEFEEELKRIIRTIIDGPKDSADNCT